MQKDTDFQSWEWSVDSKICYDCEMSEKAEVLGVNGENLRGRPLFSGMEAEDLQKTKDVLYNENGIPQSFPSVVGRYRRNDGTLVLLETSGVPLFTEQGDFVGFKGNERVIASISLQSSESVGPTLEAVYAMAPIPLCVVDRSGRLLAVNYRHGLLTDQKRSSLVGTFVADLHPESGEKIKEDFARLDAGMPARESEIEVLGREYAVSVTPLYDASGKVVAISVVHFDVTERNRLKRELETTNKRLEYMSVRDPLTGAYNRRHFDMTLKRAAASMARHGGDLSIVMVDIDHYKHYNDTYGHIAGDECLVFVVKAMMDALIRADDALFRYGGEEFALVLCSTGHYTAKKICERLKNVVWDLEKPHRGSPFGRVTISIGFASVSCPPSSMGWQDITEKLLKASDQALYAAKNAGRNAVSGVRLVDSCAP